jgi:phosphoglycerate kinase
MTHNKITYIDEGHLKEKKVILRLDLNVSLNPDFSIADDARIKQTLPTIEYLLKNKNKLIIMSHLGRPKEHDLHYSLKNVAGRLEHYLPHHKVILVENYFSPDTEKKLVNQKENEIIMMENTRFYPEEKDNNPEFAKRLAAMADAYVNDAFAVSHRKDASIVGIPKFLPAYGGLLLKKEVETISKAIQKPKKPVVTIVGGAKISTKIELLDVFIELSDYILIGGALANNFLVAKGYEIGESLYEKAYVETAKKILEKAKKKNTQILIPSDVCVKLSDTGRAIDVTINEIPSNGYIIDIGSETQAEFGWTIDKAKTIIWNGPMGNIEDPRAREGTNNIFYSIASNPRATSIVGGGDTIAAIAKEEYLEKITHISTGGGAMLEFIEKRTLPGIEALEKA